MLGQIMQGFEATERSLTFTLTETEPHWEVWSRRVTPSLLEVYFTYSNMHRFEQYHLVSFEKCEIHETIIQVKV